MAARPRQARYLSLPITTVKSRSSSISDRSDFYARSDDSLDKEAFGDIEPKKPKPSRKRASKPKVRTGCITCKSRHVKCDEGKPGCGVCQKLNLKCEGYLPPKVKRQPTRTERLLLPRPKLALLELPKQDRQEERQLSAPVAEFPLDEHVILRPAPSLGLDLLDDDGWYFTLFRDQVACELSPYYQSNFWNKTLLRESTIHQCIRHSILSIGAYARALIELRQETPWSGQASHPWRSPSPFNRHHQAALEHNSKALYSLRSHLQSHGIDNRLTMAATLLFIVFQNMQGNYHRSGDLIRTGIKVLNGMRRSSNANARVPVASQWQSDLLEPITEIDEMADMFARHSITYVFVPFPHAKFAYHLLLTEDTDDDESDDEDENVLDPQLSLPQTVEQARRKWDYLLPILASFQSKAVWHNLNPSFELDQVASLEEQAKLLKSLREFGLALDALASANTDLDASVTSHEACGLEFLRLQHMMAVVFVSCCLDPTEMAYDNFLPEFEALVRRSQVLAQTYLQVNTNTKIGFTNEVGILLLLAFTGAKCRVRSVRIQAIDLMRQFDWREGSWDGVSLAYGVEGVMRLEGQQLDFPLSIGVTDSTGSQHTSCSDIVSLPEFSSSPSPEIDVVPTAEARYTWTNMFWDFDKRHMTLEYSRVLRNELGDFERARWEMDEAGLMNRWSYFAV